MFGEARSAAANSPWLTGLALALALFAAAILIWFLAPWFTPPSGVGLAVTALALPLAGFAGDVTMSAVKRDLGVKDTSRLIPGHGGLLDRFDGLLFCLPATFYLCRLLDIF